MRARRGTRGLALWLGLVLAVLLALTGCGAGDSAATSEDAALPAPAEAAGDQASDAAGGGEAGDDAATGPGAVTLEVGTSGRGRQVITSSVDVAVDDVPAAARRVRDIAVVAGGFVSGESSVGGEQPRTEITLRVPVAGTTQVMTDVAGLGDEVSRTTDSQDVEAQLVDLESRTATQRAGVARVRALLDQAEDLEDVLTLEAELTRRQGDLESVEAQQVALADRAALAAVTVLLTRPDDVEVTEALPPFLDGLRAGWDALGASTGVVLVVLGALLPFAAVAVVLAAALAAVMRTVRRRPRVAEPGA